MPCLVARNHPTIEEKLQTFVTSPFANYKKIHDKLKAHLCTKYHDMCQTQADAFLKCQVAKIQDDILNQLDAKKKKL